MKLLILSLFLLFSCDNSTESSCTESVDCAGDCGGEAAVDECGDCNGDGPDMCWDGSYECDSSDCPDQPGGSVEINYNSDTAIAVSSFM